jgi:uncharacterized protein YegJ (DUF2314 family)
LIRFHLDPRTDPMTTTLPRGFRTLALAAALLACATARATAQDGNKAPTASGIPIVNVTDDDAEMNAAIARARATTDELMARLRRPPPALSYLGVKVQLGDEDAGEHIWLYEVRLEGDRITGRLLEDAEYYPRYHRGDVIRVLPQEITDWMTVENGHVCGGFTARVLVPRLRPDERKAYFQSMELRRLPPGDRVCDKEDGG